ncbi:MAG: hypothetical protein WA705_22060 [Candidatus Ozemobacteraceae bacterium]
MVEVSPHKTEIQVHNGGMIFSFFLLIVFPLLFWFVANTGASWYIIGTCVIVAIFFDIWYFQIPLFGGILMMLVIACVAAVKHFF